MRIGLVVDHPKRDLDGAALLAHHLVARGATAVIVPMYAQGTDVPLLKLDAIVVNYARSANQALLAMFKRLGTRVFVLDTEGGVLAETGGNSPPSMASAFRDKGFGAVVDGYFFWGGTLRDAFASAKALPDDALHLTGSPRFDFAAEKWRAMLDRDRRGYVLVNANFPLVNPRFSRAPAEERMAMIKAGWDPAYVDRLLTDLTSVFARYLQTLRDLATARPNVRFLVRPHPFESQAPYAEALAGLPNVEIDGAGSVLNVIHNSRAILHLNCGTAIEAVMLGKLPIQLDFLNTEATAGHATLPAKVSAPARSFEEVLAMLDDLPGHTAAFDFADRYERFVLPFFHLSDGLAGDRVADVLTTMLAADTPSPRRSARLSLVSGRASPSLGQLAQGAVSTVFGSRFATSLRGKAAPARAEKTITPDMVSDIMESLRRHDAPEARPAGVSHARGLFGAPLASIEVS